MRRTICAAIAAAALGIVSNSARADEISVSTSDGVRTALVLPARHRHAPTVIVLHGALVSAEATATSYGFARAAGQRGFTAVFPRGVNMLWNDGRNATLASPADDVGFLKNLSRDLVRLGTADPARLYLVGISNGGMMVFRMLCEAPQPFSGAGVIIASMPNDVGAGCRIRRPMPVVMFNGTADPLIPYGGGPVGFSTLQGSVWPVERTAAFLAHANGCSGPPSKMAVAASATSDPIRVVRLDWRPCPGGSVTLYRVEGGGHQVFGYTNYMSVILGPGTEQPSSPDIIMARFARAGG